MWIFGEPKPKVDLKAEIEDSGTREESDRIMEYAAGLISRKEAIAPQLAELERCGNLSGAERERAYIKIYLELERWLVEKDAHGRYTRKKLRKEIGKKFNIGAIKDDFRLFFLTENQLGLTMVRKLCRIISKKRILPFGNGLRKDVGGIVKDTVFEGTTVDKRGIYVPEQEAFRLLSEKGADKKLMRDSKILIDGIFGGLCERVGREIAAKTMEESFRYLGEKYSYLPIPPDMVKLLPIGVLDKEKMGVFNREELEAEVRRRTAELEKSYASIRASEERYGSLFENADDAIIVVDKTGKIQSVNRAFEEKVGIGRAEVIGKNVFKIGVFGPKDIAVALKNFGRLLAGLRVPYYEVEVKARNGKVIRAGIQNSIIRTGSKITSVMVIARDVTEIQNVEKQLRESEEKFRNIFDSSSDVIVIHDLKGHILAANETACKRMGYALEEFLRMTPADIDTPENAKKVPDRMRELVEKGQITFETAHVAKDGKAIPVEVINRLISFEGKGAVLSSARDITERKRIAEELELSRSELEKKVAELERFNELAVGRELGMIELKKEIERLTGKRGDRI